MLRSSPLPLTLKRPGVGFTGHKRGAACERARLSTVTTRRREKSSLWTKRTSAVWPSSSARPCCHAACGSPEAGTDAANDGSIGLRMAGTLAAVEAGSAGASATGGVAGRSVDGRDRNCHQ
jgi:hypothetical protein